MPTSNRSIKIKDDGSVRRTLLEKNDCYVEEDEIEAFRAMASSESNVKFTADIFGKRISEKPETLRLMFFPFMTKEPFMKYSKVERISASIVKVDGRGYVEFTVELLEPVFYIETSESDIIVREIMASINELIVASKKIEPDEYEMGGRPYFEMEVSRFEQVFVPRSIELDVDDISIFFKKKKVGFLGDNGILEAGKRITNTKQNREMILRIVSREGIFNDIFSTGVQFTEQELRDKLVPKLRWGKYFERESARTAMNLLVNQQSVSQQVFIDVMTKMKGSTEFSRMIKTNKKLKKRFKDDHAILLLIVMS
jgi:hypothetical protein